MSIVNISSENATIGPDNNFEVKLKKPIQKVIGMQLLNATIPLTYNIINSSNDQLSFSYLPQVDLYDPNSTIIPSTTRVNMVATLDHGSYTAEELAVEIDHSINQAISSDPFNGSTPLLPHELRTTAQRDIHTENEDLIIRITDDDNISFNSSNFSYQQASGTSSVDQQLQTDWSAGNTTVDASGGTPNNNTLRPDKLSSVSVTNIEPGMIVLFPVNISPVWLTATQNTNSQVNPFLRPATESGPLTEQTWWYRSTAYSGSSVHVVYALGVVTGNKKLTEGSELTVIVYDQTEPTIYTWNSVTGTTTNNLSTNPAEQYGSIDTSTFITAAPRTDINGGKYPRVFLYWPGVLCHYDSIVQAFNIITAGRRRLADAIGRNFGLSYTTEHSAHESAPQWTIDTIYGTRMITWFDKDINTTVDYGTVAYDALRTTRSSVVRFELVAHINDFRFVYSGPSKNQYVKQTSFTPITGGGGHVTSGQIQNTVRMTRTVGFIGSSFVDNIPYGGEESGDFAFTNRKVGYFENNMTYRGNLLPEVHGPSLFFVRIGGDLLLDQQNTETDMNDRLAIPITAEHGEVQHFESTAKADVIPAAVPCDIHRLKFTIEYGDDNQPVGGEYDAFLGHHTYFRLKFYKQHQQGKV